MTHGVDLVPHGYSNQAAYLWHENGELRRRVRRLEALLAEKNIEIPSENEGYNLRGEVDRA